MARAYRSRSFTAVLSGFMMVLLVAAPAHARIDEVGGGAFGLGVDVEVLGVPVVVEPTPEVTLPPGGGNFEDEVADVVVPGLLTAEVLTVETRGATGEEGFAESSADVARVVIGDPAGPHIELVAVHSECRSEATGSTASATIARLTATDTEGNTTELVDLSPEPNTSIEIPGVGTIILNEQETHLEEGETFATVNAVHVVLAGPLGEGDVVLAQSRCRAFGPNVIPMGAVGGLALATVLGSVFAARQWNARRRTRRDDTA